MDARIAKIAKGEEDKRALAVELKNSRVLDTVRDNITAMIESKTKTKLDDYDKPNWAYYRADQDGYIRALTEVLNLIKK